jgi:hypothetical protein
MGKTARNEQKKLRATAFNSLGVGVAMAGIYVPMLGFYLVLLSQKVAAV